MLNQNLQKLTTNQQVRGTQTKLPLFIAIDYEGGFVSRLKESKGFPQTLSAQKIGQLPYSDAVAIAESMAKTLKQNGFNLNFAPVADLNINPENPVIGKLERSFSDDDNTVFTYNSIFANAYVSNNIQCALKHFPGHGSSSADSHLGFVDVTNTWQKKELEPYRLMQNSYHQCGMVMTAHIVNRQLDDTGLPATLSHKMLTQILRQELQFDGVIISDDMHMKAITDHYGFEQALVMSVNAGVDVFIISTDINDENYPIGKIINVIEQNVAAGKISLSRINQSYHRIVNLKQDLI